MIDTLKMLSIFLLIITLCSNEFLFRCIVIMLIMFVSLGMTAIDKKLHELPQRINVNE